MPQSCNLLLNAGEKMIFCIFFVEFLFESSKIFSRIISVFLQY